MAKNKFNEASMFNMLTGIDRAIKSEAYKKYDLPTFYKGGKTGEEPPAKGAKKKAYQDAITANVYDYLKRTNYKTPHVPGKTIDDLGREMNCIHGVCQIVEGTGAKKFSQEYFGNMVFDDNMKKEGFYYAQPETEGFEVGDFLRFARTKGNANLLARYSGSVNPLNEDDLIPQHTSFILDKYKDDNGVTMYSIANNHGEEDVETNEVSEEELLQWAQKGKGSFDKMLIARYDPDKVAEDAEKSEKINKILSGENSYAGKYSGRKPGVTLKEKDELAEELLGYYKKNYEKLGKSSDLPPEVLDKLFVKQIGIAKQESTTGSRSIGKSVVPDVMLPYARKVADALFDNDNWILDYWNKNADDVKSKFKSIKEFTDYVTKDIKLDKEAREYLRYNSPASKGMFQQKELSQRGRFHKSGFDTPEDQFISSMDLAIDNYHKVKDKYPDMFEPELVELTTLMHNSPFKALTPEYVNYYLKNQNIDYVNKVNKYIPSYEIDRPIEKETELQKFIQKRAKPLSITETANTVSPEEKKKIVNFLLNQNKKEYGGELESFQDGGKKKNTPSKDIKDLQTLPEFNVISAVPGSEYEKTLEYLQNLEEYAGNGYYNLWNKAGTPHIDLLSDKKERPNFNPFTNTMKVLDMATKYKNYPFYPELKYGVTNNDIIIEPDEFISELAHAKQLKDAGILKFAGRGILDWFKSPYFTAYGLHNKPSQYEEGALWGKGQYDTPGTIEYEAHKEIEPALSKELYDNLGNQTNYKIDVKEKQYGGSTKYGDGGKTSPPKKNIAVLGVKDGSSKKHKQNIFIESLTDYERDIEKWLGNPMQKAQKIKKSEPVVTPGTSFVVNPLRLTPEQIEQRQLQDNERHSAAGYYTAKAITDKFPEWSQYTGIPQAIGTLGSIGLGIGHEITSNKYTRPHENDPYTKWNVLREALEDGTNNTVGAIMNAIPFMSESEKIDALKYMSDNNMLPDGVDFPNGKNLYWKNEKGEINKPYKKKQYGGLAKFVDGGGKKGTEQNPFELPEITITPDTKRQAEMAEMYKYMPEDVKQAIAYDMENPDILTESPEEQSYLSRGFDAVTHPFAALGELHNRKSLQSNWLALNQDRLGPNFLDWALYGTAAARFLPQAAKELPKYLSSSLPGMSKIPGATLGNALASQGIVNTLLRESGYSGDEDPSTVREWEKYKEGSQDLSNTLANTGVNLLDVGLTAFGDFKPFISETAKELKRDYKTVKDAFDPNPTMNDVIGKIIDLKAKNRTSFKDGKMPFRELKKQKVEFWNTPEGRRRVQKYIDENIARYDPDYTVDDYIKEMSEIEYANPIEVQGQRHLKEIRQKSLEEQFDNITEKNKLLVELSEKISNMQQNRRMSNTNTFIPEEERNLIDEFTRLKTEYKKATDEYNDLRDRHITENYFPENNAFYWGREMADKTPVGGGPIIHIGEDYALSSNLQNTLWHEFGHAQNLYPLNKRFRPLPQKAGVNFRLRNNLDFEDFALNSQKLREYNTHLKSREKGDYVPPDYVFPTEEQILEWENSIPPWLNESQLDLAKMYKNAEPISQGSLGMFRYQDPKAYTKSEFSYFYSHDEANAFLNELIPELMREGHMTKLGDKIEPKMLKQLFENYRNSGKTKMTEAVRLLDFVKPTEKSLKALAEELNNLQVLLIGAGGASVLKAAGAFDNKEANIEQQKFGGNISNLQKFIR